MTERKREEKQETNRAEQAEQSAQGVMIRGGAYRRSPKGPCSSEMTETLKEKEKEKGKLLDEGRCEMRAGNGTREANGKEQKKRSKNRNRKKWLL